MSELEDRINNLILINRSSAEQSINIEEYGGSIIQEVKHRVLCKETYNFEIWLKINNPINIKYLIDMLKQNFKYSSFQHNSDNSLSNCILCKISAHDIQIIQKNKNDEVDRYESRIDTINQLNLKKQEIQKLLDEKMTLLQQTALELQKKRDREIAEVHFKYLKDKQEIENQMSDIPKKYKDELSKIYESLSLLKKCSHGFSLKF
jgi:hypothetical protein